MTDEPLSSPADILNKLASALTIVSRGDPITALRSEVETRLNSLITRFDAIDRATALQHEDLVRVPTQVDRAVTALRELVDQKIHAAIVDAAEQRGREVVKLQGDIAVSDERFKGIQTQFQLLKQATEQLDLANKTAIAAALQAQKESAGETQKSSQAAIAKSEASMLEAIRALTATFNAAIGSATGRIDDLKGRMDRGEGKTSVNDPAITEMLRTQAAALAALSVKSDKMEGRDSGFGIMWAAFIAIVGVGVVVIPMLFNRPAPDGIEKNNAAIAKLEFMMEQHQKLEEQRRMLPPALSGGSH